MTLSTHPTSRSAFTFVEVMIVVVIIGILAAIVVPQFGGMTSDARAVSEGRPHAVLVDLNAQTLTPYEITTTGAAPSTSQAADGRDLDALILAATYPGVTVKTLQAGDGSYPSAAYIWFGVDGTPQLRNTAGTLVSNCSHDAVLTLEDDSTISVIRYSGAIER